MVRRSTVPIFEDQTEDLISSVPKRLTNQQQFTTNPDGSANYENITTLEFTGIIRTKKVGNTLIVNVPEQSNPSGSVNVDGTTLVENSGVISVGTISESKVTGLASDLSSCEKTANKNASNGYAGLSSGLLTASQIPVDNVTTEISGGKLVAIASAPGGSAGGSLSGTYPNPSLATVNSSSGTTGSASQSSVITTNSGGQVTSNSNVSIQIAESQVTGLSTSLAAKADIVSGTVPTSELPIGSNTQAGIVQVDGTTITASSGVISGVQLSTTTPPAESYGASGAVGTGTTAARADHVHALPSLPLLSTLQAGLAPQLPGGTTEFLRADGTYAVPPGGGGGGGVTSVNTRTGAVTLTGADIPAATTSAQGAIPALPGVATEYLNGNGGWSTPAGGGGTSGPRGSLWYSGTGAPGTISGQANGDWYLDPSTGNVYELVSGVWTLEGNIKGQTGSTGAAGARGSLWYPGTGAPGTISGQANGDWYLDASTGNIYELIGGVWTLEGNIKGGAGSGSGSGNVTSTSGSPNSIAMFDSTTDIVSVPAYPIIFDLGVEVI